VPAEKYGYHLTPEQMTFGHLIVHIVETNVMLCSLTGDLPVGDMPKLSDADPKEALVKAIKTSVDTCNGALARLTNAQLGDELTMGGRKVGCGPSRSSRLPPIGRTIVRPPRRTCG